MFTRPGPLWPRGRVHATFTPDIMGKNVTYVVVSELDKDRDLDHLIDFDHLDHHQ